MKILQVVSVMVAMFGAGAAGADEVVLKNGSVIEGIVREEGDRVVVELDSGTVSFGRSQVRSIERRADVHSEYERRLSTASRPEDYLALAAWAREQGMGPHASRLYRKILALDPDHRQAREALGYRKFKDMWMTEDQYRIALGFLSYRGQWLPRETVEKILNAEKEIQLAQIRQAMADESADVERQAQGYRLQAELERIDAAREGTNNLWVPWIPPVGSPLYRIPTVLPAP